MGIGDPAALVDRWKQLASDLVLWGVEELWK